VRFKSFPSYLARLLYEYSRITSKESTSNLQLRFQFYPYTLKRKDFEFAKKNEKRTIIPLQAKFIMC